MLRLCLFLGLLGIALAGGDAFMERYAYSKAMYSCFGEDLYGSYDKQRILFTSTCMQEVWTNRDPRASFLVEKLPMSLRKKREAMFSSELLWGMLKVVKAKGEILMCVAKKMQLLDDDKNVNIAFLKQQPFMVDIEPALKKDLFTVIDKCFEVSKSLEGKDSSVPIEVQRIIAFFKCNKTGKLSACMKADLRKHMGEFELSGIPEFEGDEDAKVEKLLHVLWGTDAGSDPMDLWA